MSATINKYTLKMWISFVYLIFLGCSTGLGEEYFDCRRQGQDCANNKTCQNDGTCDCGNDYTGYNCELQKSLSGASPCTSQTDSCGSDGGICYNDNGNKACFCPSGFYGDSCENKRYEVSCQKSSMLIVINPAGTFSGVIYTKGEKDTPGCKFTSSILPSGRQGVALNVNYTDCGVVTEVNGDRNRDVIIQFSEKYMTNLDIKVTVTCSEKNKDYTIVTVSKVITSKETDRNRLNITNTVNSIDSSLIQFNINLKDGSSVSESAAVSLDEELTFEFITTEVPAKIADIDPVKVRLVDGNTSKEGRLEVLHKGEWCRLRGFDFSYYSATVVCRTLGFNNAFGMRRGKGFFPEGTGPIWVSELVCIGFETNVDNCYTWDFYDCGDCPGYDNGLICDENPTPYKLKLVGGNSKEEGNLQVFDDDKWNSVCNTKYYEENNADVVCRQMGYTKVEESHPGETVTGNKWKYEVISNGSEPALHLSILRLRNEESECKSLYIKCSVDISDIELRLVGGPDSNYGVVEVKINNEWGRMNNDFSSPAVARVLCRTLGFNESYKAILLSENEHNLKSSNNKIWTSRVYCSGLEKNINECFFQYSNHNDHEKYTALLCSDEKAEIEIRLVGGSSKREGRVEIKYLGMWGTVCDKYHTDYNAAVYCRMLGFTNSNATAIGTSHFGEGSGPIFLRDIHCLGNETSLEQCNFQWGNFHCNHGQDASIKCAELESGTLRVESCTADNQKTGEDSETLKIIEDSCPSSEIGKLMIQEPKRSGNKVTFKLKAFTFNKNNAVSTECSVKVCPPDQISLCDSVDCNGKKGFGRKRRSAETSDERVRKTFTVLNLMNEDRTSSISHASGEKHGSDQVNVSETILIVLSVVMVIFFLLVIGIVVIVFLKKKKSYQ